MNSNSKEFLDSLIESGKLVYITLNTKNEFGLNDQIVASIIWHDKDTIGVKFVNEYNKLEEDITAAPAKMVKQKIVMYYKTAIQNISTEWQKLEEEPPF
jgi:H2-forming N5,N10-methylenetetrahydromethanopterin dehydrogenase-like enzyme